MKQFKAVGELVKNARISKGLSQCAVSNILGYKNGQFISNIERGLSSVPDEKLKVTCEILSIEFNDMLNAKMKDFKLFIHHSLWGYDE